MTNCPCTRHRWVLEQLFEPAVDSVATITDTFSSSGVQNFNYRSVDVPDIAESAKAHFDVDSADTISTTPSTSGFPNIEEELSVVTMAYCKMLLTQNNQSGRSHP